MRLSWSLLFAFHSFCDRLAQGQLVIAHCVISFMRVVTKRDFIETIPFIIHLTDLLSVSIQKIVSEEEDLVVRKVPLIWYCSKFDNTDD